MPSEADRAPGTLLDLLLDGGVVAPSSQGDRLELTTDFEQAVETTLQEDKEAIAATVSARIPSDVAITEHVSDTQLLARIDALAAFVAEELSADGDPFEPLIQLALVLDQFGDDAPPEDGAPEGFLPLRGDRIETVMQTYPAAIVYVWREDCLPCDDVKETLESIADSQALGLFAVYGPAWARLLQTRHDVVGAPTTLFLCNGQIDSRIQGSRTPDIFEREAATIRERSTF